MFHIPDFDDARYLNEVGWFLYREKYGHNHFTGSYAKERLLWSQMLLEEFLHCYEKDRKWVEDKTVVSIGCGCTGDLAAWPAAVSPMNTLTTSHLGIRPAPCMSVWSPGW